MISGAPLGNQSERNQFMRSVDESYTMRRGTVSASKLNEVVGSNPVTPSKNPGVPEYFAFGSSLDYQAGSTRV